MTTDVIEVSGQPDAETIQADGASQPASEATSETTKAEPQDGEAKEAKQEPAEKPQIHKWAQKRIDQLTARAKTAEAALERVRVQDAASGAEPNVHEIAERIAEQKMQQRAFDDACNSVYQEGIKAHKEKFAPSIDTLYNVFGPEEFPKFLESTVDAKDAGFSAELLIHFAENPNEASAFVDLNARAQGRELERLAAKFQSRKVAKASAAPAPVSTVSGAGKSNTAAAGTEDEADWYARRAAEVKKLRR